ncbi:MAG: D-alanyl-D-alanine carboxypeptidase family protein [Thermoleophilaceae bacterium]
MSAGARRGRGADRLAPLALILAPIVVVAGAWLAFGRERDERPERPRVAVATGSEAQVGALEGGGSLEGRSPAAIRLTGVDAFSLRFRRPPRAALVFDLDSGEALFRRSALRARPIASLTKIMTALLVVQASAPDDRVRITPAALRYEGSGVGVLPKGRAVRLETLLNGLMLVSGNDAAIALAVHVSGSERRFVRLMNEQARLWGLTCTRFASAHGLEDGNRSCPEDLAVLTRLAMREPRIARIARRGRASFGFPIKGGRLFLAGHNPLLRLGYRGAIGLKTGYTVGAGACFVGVARRAGRTLGVVLLDSPDPGRQASRLLDLGFRAG